MPVYACVCVEGGGRRGCESFLKCKSLLSEMLTHALIHKWISDIACWKEHILSNKRFNKFWLNFLQVFKTKHDVKICVREIEMKAHHTIQHKHTSTQLTYTTRIVAYQILYTYVCMKSTLAHRNSQETLWWLNEKCG